MIKGSLECIINNTIECDDSGDCNVFSHNVYTTKLREIEDVGNGWYKFYIRKRCHPDDKEYFKVTREEMMGSTIEEISNTSKQRIPSLQKQLEPFRKILKENPYIA